MKPFQDRKGRLGTAALPTDQRRPPDSGPYFLLRLFRPLSVPNFPPWRLCENSLPEDRRSPEIRQPLEEEDPARPRPGGGHCGRCGSSGPGGREPTRRPGGRKWLATIE